MSFPAWNKCFLSCGFLIWKSRLGLSEPQFVERRQLEATVAALVVETIPFLAGLRIRVLWNRSRPDSSNVVGPIPLSRVGESNPHTDTGG